MIITHITFVLKKFFILKKIVFSVGSNNALIIRFTTPGTFCIHTHTLGMQKTILILKTHDDAMSTEFWQLSLHVIIVL